MTSLLVDELWKRFSDKEAELDKVINEYIDKGIIKVNRKSDRTNQHIELIGIIDHIESIRKDMILYGNQWREFKWMEEERK